MELLQYWAIIRRWLWLVVLTTLLAAAAALVVSLRTTPEYRATTQILIQQASNPSNLTTYSDILTSERLARTYSKLLTNRPVLEQALQELDMDGEQAVADLKDSVSVQPVRDTTLIQLSVEDTDPARAVALANEIPKVFARYNENVQLSRYRDSKQNLETQLKRLEADLTRIQTQLDAVKAADNADPAQVLPLETQLTSLQTSYASLLRQYEEVRLAEAGSVDTIVVSEPALEAKKVRPRTMLNTLLAAIVGLMLGLGAAFLIEYLDDTVKSPDDVARLGDIPVLTGIARVQEDDHLPLVTQAHAKSPVSEAFRVLRTNIQFASVDNPLRTLLITSSAPSEGKSFITANLAVVMAQMGRRVVIVDADLRKPMQHKIFDLPNNLGLTTALLAERGSEVTRHVQGTQIPGVQVLTSGPIPPNPSELLGSQRMGEIVHDLLESADVVLFDTPPALAVTDAAVLSRGADGVLLIVEVGKTRQPALYQALAELHRAGTRILGVVLNSLPPRGSAYYSQYYYSYTHYYDYYRDEEGEVHPNGKRPWSRKRKARA